ncbi:MAG: MBL fold metallo-hydrolase [Rhodospirillaceae bacterium]|nr:MBL fold metallo-hydrolase [Rhodospirillaceae bacterium]
MVRSSKNQMEFNRNFECEYGQITQVSPLIRRIVANNPGPYTFKGTGTYVIGYGDVGVIDPGPDDQDHVNALLNSLQGEKITHQIITHTHLDHSPAARYVSEKTGAKTYAIGPHGLGKIAKEITVEAGGDMSFTPDILVKDGDIIEGNGWSLECVHTPGHTSNHLCLSLIEENSLFTGDHVMGWSTTVVSPPDGDMSDYILSLKKLLIREDKIYYPTHGGAIFEPQKYVRAIIVHRKLRENQILDCISKEINNIPDMVSAMYEGLDQRLIKAAQHSILSHIIDLVKRDIICTRGEVGIDAEYEKL